MTNLLCNLLSFKKRSKINPSFDICQFTPKYLCASGIRVHLMIWNRKFWAANEFKGSSNMYGECSKISYPEYGI